MEAFSEGWFLEVASIWWGWVACGRMGTFAPLPAAYYERNLSNVTGPACASAPSDASVAAPACALITSEGVVAGLIII
jgi:hypothetical protein